MKNVRNFLVIMTVTFGCALQSASAAVQVFACEPEWAALAREIGGDRVDPFAATTGLQDPHTIQARPSLIARMRSADLLVCTGAELEVGWLPQLLRQGANAKVQPGAPGYFEATRFVQLRETPTTLDRSMGDIHAGGNPHIQTDPRNMLRVAEALAERLTQIDPAGADTYKSRQAAFAARFQSAIEGWEKLAAPLKDAPILVQHKSWVYLIEWLGMREIAPLEPKPGIAPSTTYLAELLRKVEAAKPRMILVAAYEDDRGSKWMAEHAKIPVATLPFTVGGADGTDSLTALYDTTIKNLLNALH
jgi:zinc/manganese transport system substrate-binding protein